MEAVNIKMTKKSVDSYQPSGINIKTKFDLNNFL